MNEMLKTYLADIDMITVLDDISIKYGHATAWGYLKSITAKIIYKRISIEANNPKQDIIFFKSESSHRPDHNQSFFNAYETAGNNVGLITATTKKSFSIIRSIKKIGFMLKYAKRVLNKKSLRNNLARINALLIIDDFSNAINDIDFTKAKLGVVYYDVSKYDYMFVQLFKKRGIKTATLQHAAFVAPRKVSSANFEFEGVELCNSTSDYFLAWNPFTKEEAIKSGMSESKIKVLGIPKYINTTVDDIRHKKTFCFGVVLNAKSFDSLNRRLIQYADFVANKTGYSYYLKYHPQFQEFIYDSLPKSGKCIGHLELSKSVSDYVRMVDFTLISNSTVFIELIYMGHTVFRLQAGDADKFRNVPYNAFTNEEELDELLNGKIAESSNQLFSYMCFTRNPKAKYKNFFLNVGGNE